MKRKLKRNLSFVILMAMFTSLIIILTPVTVLADDGTPYPGPSAPNIPCTIEAENFNNGGQGVGYYDTTAGNQGNSAYRSADADLFMEGSVTYVYMNGTFEWLKYSFNVPTAGWYKISYNYRSIDGNETEDIYTCVDFRGLNHCRSSSTVFTNIDAVPAVYLSSGNHILRIQCGRLHLNSITFASISAPQALTPKVVGSPQVTDEYVIADAQVTDSPYNADNTGVNDCTSAIQTAIDDVWKMGGGTVFIPVGKYKVDGTLTIRENITLRGDWKSPLNGGSGNGTILKASSGRDNENGTPFIQFTSQNSAVCFLSIWYPDQHYSASTIHAYPYTIDVPLNRHGNKITNITLYNSYNGIKVFGGSTTTISDVYGTVLKNGVIFDNCWDFSYIYNIAVENSIWKNAPTNVITNAPTAQTDRNNLDDYTSENRIGVQIGHADAVQCYNLSVKEAWKDILVKKGIVGDLYEDYTLYGVLSKVTGSVEIQDAHAIMHPLMTDDIPEAASLSYTFSSNKKSAKSTFYNVMNSPYNAMGNGITDDSSAIQNALNAAGSNGGGIVYLPAGMYKISTHLSVPTGVELRGQYGCYHGYESYNLCWLLAYEGKDCSDPLGSTPFIDLSHDSGVRGISIYYPEQGFGSAALPVRRFPSTIKGEGSGVWVKDVHLINSYVGINLMSARCDNHLLMGVFGAVLDTLVYVGADSQNGVMERMEQCYGSYKSGFNNNPQFYGLTNGYNILGNYNFNGVVPYKLYNCTNEKTFGLDCFNVYTGFVLGCTNATLWQPQIDYAKCAFYIQGGNNTNIIGTAVGSGSTGGQAEFRTVSGFTGTYNIYGYYTWFPGKMKDITSGTINFYNPVSLSTSKPVTANGYTGGDVPGRAVSRGENDKWCYTYNGTNWLDVDLGQPSEVYGYIVKSAGINGESQIFNTKKAAFESSIGGWDSTQLDLFDNNTFDYLWRKLPLVQTRNAKLKIYEGTQPGYDEYARIYEFEVYGRAGWHFTTGTEGWFKMGTVSSFSASGGRLILTSNGSDPQICSQNNLNVDAGTYKKVRVRFKNGTPSNIAQLLFITNSDTFWGSNGKYSNVFVNTNDPLYTDYVFDFTGNNAWSGTIKQIRFDPSIGAGNIGIEYIKFEKNEGGIPTPTPTPTSTPTPTPAVPNLALYKTTYSSVAMYAGHEADKTVDGSTTTYAQASSVMMWGMRIDLGTPTLFSKIVYKPDWTNYAVNFKFEGSNDLSNWYTLVYETTGNGTNKTYTFGNVSYRYVRLNVSTTYGTFPHAVREIEIYSY